MKIMKSLVQLALKKTHQHKSQNLASFGFPIGPSLFNLLMYYWHDFKIRLWCGHSLIIIFLKKKNSYKEVLFFSAGLIVCLLGLRPLEASKLPVLFRRKITFGGAGLVMTSSLIGRKTCRR